MELRILLLLLVVFVQVHITVAVTSIDDYGALSALKSMWTNSPPNWVGGDPCGSGWVGIRCNNSRVISITLASMNLGGQLPSDIAFLTELQTLDLSNNKNLIGSLPASIGYLKKLRSISLGGCGFTEPIPDTIGSLSQLVSLSLNSNGFSGKIPHSIGNLSNLYWLDLTDNQLEGSIPVSDGTNTHGLDLLVHTKHFHLGQNKLSGKIPPQLFSADMILIHVIFDSNELSGPIPSTLGLVKTLETVRFGNNSLTGDLPSNLNNLTHVNDLYLSNNNLSGPLPNLTGMNSLNTLDLSNNSFDAAALPSWFPTLQSLTTLVMESIQLQGPVPVDLFSLPHLQTMNLKDNRLNGTLDIDTSFSGQLKHIDLQGNLISGFNQSAVHFNGDIILMDNPICEKAGENSKTYCALPQANSSFLYATPPMNCRPVSCSSGQLSSPMCRCAYPYRGTLVFKGITFSDLANVASYKALEQSLNNFSQTHQLPVDSVSLSNPKMDSSRNLELHIDIFPSGQPSFNRTGVSMMGFIFGSQSFKPPSNFFGPYLFTSENYNNFADESAKSNKSSTGIIIGAVVGGSVLVLLLMLAGVYGFRQKKKAERATKESNPFASWDVKKSSGSIPQLKGARCFYFEELKKYTNNFSEANDIGSGGYGKVYRGTLPAGELVAIKRAQQGSMQGVLEFKTEIELLSRVHHKNVVSLLGFCFDRGEQILIYEYIPNGSLNDSLSGKSGIRLDWARRLKIALGAARGLQYLHELANPPIIHRDIKSTNILLDDRLNAKVADFGLSKPKVDSEKGHVSTQVKGTMGYLDPEYYVSQQLTEKSDVYGFGVLLLELITARRPIERGKYIVREVKMAMDKTKDLYNLHQFLDPTMGLGTTLKGLEKFVDLAMNCVEESGADRPTMGEVVKEIENIMQLAGMNPNAESATSSASYEEASKADPIYPYGGESFA